MSSMENRRHQLLLQAAFGLFLLGLYSVAALVFMPETLPLPGQIVAAFLTQVTEQGLINALENALYAIFAGFVLAAVVGIPLGVIMGVNQLAEELIDPYINGLYVLPYAALVPALIIWFGTGTTVRVVITFSFALFPIVINTFEGAQTTPPNLIEVARSFDGGTLFILKSVVVPHEIPYILAGLRMGIGRAVRGLVVVEILVAVTGLGGLIQQWSAAYRLEGVISVVLVLMLLGILLPWLFDRVYERLIWWDVTQVNA